jgi:drug/metabolite transporter (DMT)-like permease
MLWLPATLLAGLLQAWRTAVQARVRDTLSVNAAGLVRYLYGLPVAILLLSLYAGHVGQGMPDLGGRFPLWTIAAGLAQLLGTNLLLMAFGYRNYVVGTAYAKTEAVQGAVLAMILLGEILSPLSMAGIAVSVAGVLVLSTGGQRLKLADLTQPAALCGLGAGFGFALTSVFVKRATFAVATPDIVLRALVTLVAVVASQMVMQGLYVAIRERNQIRPIFKSWRVSGQVGVLAALGSAFWFFAFASAPVALVRAIGQVEVIFTLLFGHFYLRQPMKRSEISGLLLVGLGVVLALLGVM